jgi:hypothetical protein
MENQSMDVKNSYRKAMLPATMALAIGFLVSCAPATRMVPTISETASQWNADVDKHIPDAERAGRLKQLGLQLIELQDSLLSYIAVLNEQAVELNSNYGATKEETRQLVAVFFEKRNAALTQYRDVIFAMRREVSADEWKALIK